MFLDDLPPNLTPLCDTSTCCKIEVGYSMLPEAHIKFSCLHLILRGVFTKIVKWDDDGMFEQEKNLIAFPITLHDGYNVMLPLMQCAYNILLQFKDFWLHDARDMIHNGKNNIFSLTFDNLRVMTQRPELLSPPFSVSVLVSHLYIEEIDSRTSVLLYDCAAFYPGFPSTDLCHDVWYDFFMERLILWVKLCPFILWHVMRIVVDFSDDVFVLGVLSELVFYPSIVLQVRLSLGVSEGNKRTVQNSQCIFQDMSTTYDRRHKACNQLILVTWIIEHQDKVNGVSILRC